MSIQQTTECGYVVAGHSNSNGGNVSGVIEWEKSLGGTGNDRANSIQQTSDGSYEVLPK
jgi:hypothetical protein